MIVAKKSVASSAGIWWKSVGLIVPGAKYLGSTNLINFVSSTTFSWSISTIDSLTRPSAALSKYYWIESKIESENKIVSLCLYIISRCWRKTSS